VLFAVDVSNPVSHGDPHDGSLEVKRLMAQKLVDTAQEELAVGHIEGDYELLVDHGDGATALVVHAGVTKGSRSGPVETEGVADLDLDQPDIEYSLEAWLEEVEESDELVEAASYEKTVGLSRKLVGVPTCEVLM